MNLLNYCTCVCHTDGNGDTIHGECCEGTLSRTEWLRDRLLHPSGTRYAPVRKTRKAVIA